ncbi:MAG: carboxypeptidase-like regulatory domain-containing protein [Bryobacterales bacterium]|nr:carboxypeptidase-like regulatory domain-containing protein [Bryobacterales bacterium]
MNRFTFSFGKYVLWLSLVALIVSPIRAQQISGSIAGGVKDEQGAVIAGAKVTLVNVTQAGVREITTGADGRFVFTPLQPATYTVTVEAQGFKKYEITEIKMFASDRIALPDIVLSLGAVAETITVEGNVVMLQSESAERSGVLTGRQVVDLALANRSFFGLAGTIAGVTLRGDGLGSIFANGSRGNQNNLTVDGVTNVDTGSNGGPLATLNIDQIAEFKIVTNSQPAEMGRSSGAAIQVVSKSGTSEFHGTAYWFHRHESLNANNWRNNADGIGRNRFRRNVFGYNVGGPVLLPGTNLNRNRDKLFFFWSQEFQRQLVPNGIRSVLVPTAAERQGDFSATVEATGAPVTIRDPLAGAPFAGNRVPANRISADGQKILNFYPMPNAAGIAPNFNFQTAQSHDFPRREELLRGDYNITDNWRFYSRFANTLSQQDMAYGQWNADYNIPFGAMNFGNGGWSYMANLTTIINPTLTNEFIFGSSRNDLNIDPVDNAFDRSALGLSYQMPFQSADSLGLIQNWRFNVPNAPFTSFNGTPFRNFNHTFDFTNNMTKVFSSHTLKAGVYLHKSLKDQTAFTSVNGDIWFNRNAQNPLDTNWAYSNAITGTFEQLAQSNVVRNGEYRNWNVEWFVQDTWKVTPKLTIDYGMRFYWIQPQYDRALQTSSFNPGLWNEAHRAAQWQRGRNAQGALAAINPLTGAAGPLALVGSIINTGNSFIDGLYVNGIGLSSDPNYPRGLINDRGIHYAPRLGLAWNFADKMVLRAGGGVFYDRFQGNPVFDMLPNPPSTIRPTFFFGTLDTIQNLQGTFFPANLRGFDQGGHIPTTYNWNVSIQREMPFNILFDVGYVGMASNHNLSIQNLNQMPFGSAWLPENQDPTNANPQFDGTTTKNLQLYRPFGGYGNINVTNFGAFSNYHAMQMSANRRLGKSLTFGVAYTWSKVMGIAGGDGDVLHPTNFRSANYGPLFYDRTHQMVVNYVYELPKLGEKLGNNWFSKGVLDGWVVSGLSTMSTGEPVDIGFSVAGLGGADVNRIWTGSETFGPRVAYASHPNLSRGQREIDAFIDTSVVQMPAVGSQGIDSGSRVARNPGINNWDVSLFKNIYFGDQNRFLQLRFEMFNAPNHTQFSGFNTGAQFNRATGQVANLPVSRGGTGGRYGFGALTGARDPRLIQLAMKFYF